MTPAPDAPAILPLMAPAKVRGPGRTPTLGAGARDLWILPGISWKACIFYALGAMQRRRRAHHRWVETRP